MTRILHTAHDPLHLTAQRELGHGIRPIFTIKPSGLVWCELKLPLNRFTVSWACCPGNSKEAALANAIRNAKRHQRSVA